MIWSWEDHNQQLLKMVKQLELIGIVMQLREHLIEVVCTALSKPGKIQAWSMIFLKMLGFELKVIKCMKD
jgi:hypothetical protein